MARARNIKPAFFTNELLGTQEPIVGMTFIGIWCLADRDGILEDRPLRIKGELFPYRENLDVNGYLTVLEQLGFIYRYVVDGVGYIQIANFSKHQTPHNTEKPKNFPKYQEVKSVTVKQPLSNGEITEAKRPDSLIPDSLIPESGLRSEESSPNVDDTRPSKSGAICLVLKTEGIGSVSPSNPKLQNLINAGAEVQMFVDAARAAKSRGKSGFAYVLATVEGQMQDAKNLATQAKENPSAPYETPHERSARLRWEEATGRTKTHESNIIDITPIENQVRIA